MTMRVVQQVIKKRWYVGVRTMGQGVGVGGRAAVVYNSGEGGRCRTGLVHAELYKKRLFVAAIYTAAITPDEWDRGGDDSKSTHGDRAFPRMPACVQDLLVEVERLERHVLPYAWPQAVLHALVARQRATDLLRLERGLICLQHYVIERLRFKYPQVVVV